MEKNDLRFFCLLLFLLLDELPFSKSSCCRDERALAFMLEPWVMDDDIEERDASGLPNNKDDAIEDGLTLLSPLAILLL